MSMHFMINLPFKISLFTLSGLILGFTPFQPLRGQEQTNLQEIRFSKTDFRPEAFVTPSGETWEPAETHPLFSYQLGAEWLDTRSATVILQDPDSTVLRAGQLEITVIREQNNQPGWKMRVVFSNRSKDTLNLHNVVPFGTSTRYPYITGQGDHGLSRAHLFLPGKTPVNVILPDNAWELGYTGFPLKNSQLGVAALSRRVQWDKDKAQRRRFTTRLLPDGSVTYRVWADFYTGEWQEGLRLIFQKRYLYDLDQFDHTLFEREDLKWIRHAYAMHLIMAWDHRFYDHNKGGYQLEQFLEEGKKWYGGNEVVGIWQNWPTLGLDQRNQWDLLRDLPGGTARIKALAEMCRKKGSRLFISYNPWDESTRWEDHHAGMSEMIAETGADGVVLDTEGKSSPERQLAGDRVKPGVVMYSEGMAVPKDMPSIVSGRVHNALYYPPMLNLNKFIKPEFAIFRVAELYLERIRREYALSLFNGYGTELNIFRPGRPEWAEEDYRFWGQTLRMLRENTSNFVQKAYTPLIPVLSDRIYVNRWPLNHKWVYTVFSLLPEGFDGPLFEAEVMEGYHYYDLWNHQPARLDTLAGKVYVHVQTDGFSKKWLGTNNEGAVGVIARLEKVLQLELEGDVLQLAAAKGDSIRIWAGTPAYDKSPHTLPAGNHQLRLYDTFGQYEGRFVVQLFTNRELTDEAVFEIKTGTARRISKVEKTPKYPKAPAGMALIPAGEFTLQTTFGDNFIPNPDKIDRPVKMPAYYLDKHPVTNADFRQFLKASGYVPQDTCNFLKHWKGGDIPAGTENFPVVYVAYEDAKAYAAWAGKRLPTEAEWQYGAQAGDGRDWPWSKDAKVERKEQYVTNTLTVSKLQVDPALCNTGDGKPGPIGRYPQGANPYGLEDLVGCVWQMTHDLYDNGTNYYIILKGGSYFLPTSSWWYVEGGPRELTYQQKLLRVSPGFERNATVGFRCAADH